MTEAVRPSEGTPDPESPSSETEGPTDADLILRVRSGDSAAYEELFVRHRDVAIRYARRISDPARAEDLCAEAFTKIFDLLQRGKGPDISFRSYLLTTVRTSHLNTLRGLGREDLVPDHEPIARMVPVIEDPDARFDQAAIFRAFNQLPERWQAALWLTSVQGMSHDEVSDRLGIKANAVASLAFRARAGLRQAYLAEHVLATSDPICRSVVNQLPSYYRDRLSARRRQRIEEHLGGCAACSGAALELSEVDSRLGALLAPLALTGFAGAGAKVTAGTATRVAATKALAATAAAAAGIALGAAVFRTGAPPPEASSQPVPATSTTAAPSASPPPAEPQPSTPRARPTRVSPTPATPYRSAPAPRPQVHPSSVPHAPADPATPAPTLGSPLITSYTAGGDPWKSVAVPVAGQPVGSTLVVTTQRVLQAPDVATPGTGWTCEAPTLSGLDGGLFATARTTCHYVGGGNGGLLRFAYQVAPQARLAAVLTPTSGASDGIEVPLGG